MDMREYQRIRPGDIVKLFDYYESWKFRRINFGEEYLVMKTEFDHIVELSSLVSGAIIKLKMASSYFIIVKREEEKEMEEVYVKGTDGNYPMLTIGDIVLIKEDGYGFTVDDLNKYCKIVDFDEESYYDCAGYKVSKYDTDLDDPGNEHGWVGPESFGENPMILFNIHEEHTVDENHVAVAVGAKAEVESVLENTSPGIDRSAKRDMVNKPSPFSVQFGGNHYKNKGIQPIEYILQNDLQFCEGNIVKYITRWREKGGIEDLEKIKHYCDFLIQKEKEGSHGESS